MANRIAEWLRSVNEKVPDWAEKKVLPEWESPEGSVFDSPFEKALDKVSAVPRWLYNEVVRPYSGVRSGLEELGGGKLGDLGLAAISYLPGKKIFSKLLSPKQREMSERVVGELGDDPQFKKLVERTNIEFQPKSPMKKGSLVSPRWAVANMDLGENEHTRAVRDLIEINKEPGALGLKPPSAQVGINDGKGFH